MGEADFLVREGVGRLLALEDDLELVASAVDEASLLDAVERTGPDVVLTDVGMPPTRTDEGIRVAALLRRRHPRIGVVVLGEEPDAGYALRLFEDGSAGRAYLAKDRLGDRAQLLDAIREVAAGGSAVDAVVVDALVEARARAESSPLARLTPRELEVLGQLAEGKSNRAIARTMGLRTRSVEKHLNAVFAKLELREDEAVSRRVAAALVFLREQPR